MTGVWMAAVAHAAPCQTASTFQQLSQVLVEGEQAIRGSDRAALEAAEARAEALMLCLGEPLAPAEVASFMRLKGIAWFVRKDRTLATRWLESARAIDPSYALPVSLIPKLHPLRTLFESIRVPPVDVVHLPPPTHGSVEVDGRQGSSVRAEHPWVLQWRGEDGEVLTTVLGDGRPDVWPYPVRSNVERVGLVALAGVQVDLGGGPGAARAGFAPSLIVPVPGPISIELGVQALFTGVDTGEETELRLVPGVSAGLRAWLATGDVRPYVGAAVAGSSHTTRPVVIGAVGALGVRVGAARFLELDLRGQVADSALVQAGIGCGWALP